MADPSHETDEIRDTDIVFDCPYCGKSLAIDYRGAGLTIPCTDCGRSVEVPIPVGMDITDLDSSEQDQEVRILNLRKSLAAAESRVAVLEQQVAALQERHVLIESQQATARPLFLAVKEKLTNVETTVRELHRTLDELVRRLVGEEGAG